MANQADQIQQAVCATIREEVNGLRTFVDRRIAELSAEVHATTQLMDFSESNLTGQLAAIREQISGVLAMPTSATRNSGLELEAVVQATEEAANRIMEAAEAIGDWLRETHSDPGSMHIVNEKVAAIFEACSFQDVTGQRIRRAIQHLQQVETMLTDLSPGDIGPVAERKGNRQRPVRQPRHHDAGGSVGQSGPRTIGGRFTIRLISLASVIDAGENSGQNATLPSHSNRR